MKKILIGILLFLSFGSSFSFADYDYCNPENNGIEKLFGEDFFEKENVNDGEKVILNKFYKDKEYICFDGKIFIVKNKNNEEEKVLAKDFEYIKYSYHFRIKNSLYYYSGDNNFLLKKDFSKYFELKDGDIKYEGNDFFKIKDKFLGGSQFENNTYFYEIIKGRKVNIDLVLEFNLDKKTFWEKKIIFEMKIKFIL